MLDDIVAWRKTPEESLAKAYLVGRSFLFVASGILLIGWMQKGISYKTTVIPTAICLLVLWYFLAVWPNQRDTYNVLSALRRRAGDGSMENNGGPVALSGRLRKRYNENIVIFTTAASVLSMAVLSWLVLATGRIDKSPFAQVIVTMVILAQILVTTPFRAGDARWYARFFRSPLLNFFSIGGIGALAILVAALGPDLSNATKGAPPKEHLLVTVLTIAISTWVNLTLHKIDTMSQSE